MTRYKVTAYNPNNYRNVVEIFANEADAYLFASKQIAMGRFDVKVYAL